MPMRGRVGVRPFKSLSASSAFACSITAMRSPLTVEPILLLSPPQAASSVVADNTTRTCAKGILFIAIPWLVEATQNIRGSCRDAGRRTGVLRQIGENLARLGGIIG